MSAKIHLSINHRLVVTLYFSPTPLCIWSHIPGHLLVLVFVCFHFSSLKHMPNPIMITSLHRSYITLFQSIWCVIIVYCYNKSILCQRKVDHYHYLYLIHPLLSPTLSFPISTQQLSELFVSFEEKPRGAASLAQVHKAVLHDGRTVAVKVQHPKVQRQSSKDIVVIEVSMCLLIYLEISDQEFSWLSGLRQRLVIEIHILFYLCPKPNAQPAKNERKV